jgi:carboxymethylenebutenolidase
MGQMIALQWGNAYFAESEQPDSPGIVLLHEWWGVQGQIQSVCDRYAALGFNAIAPDLYAGKVIPYHEAASAALEMEALDIVAATDRNVSAAADFLSLTCAKVGVTGFCLGGLLSVVAAVRLHQFSAVSCYYGLPSMELSSVELLDIPLQGHFATDDHWCTPDAVKAFKHCLLKHQKIHTIFEYKAPHGFANAETDEFRPEAADLALKRDLTFWERHLR